MIDIIGFCILILLIVGFFGGMYIDQLIKERRHFTPKIKKSKKNIKIVYIKEKDNRDNRNFTVSDYYALRENTLFK